MSALIKMRRAAVGAAKALGASALLENSEWRRRRLLIVGYHGFSLRDEHHWNGSLYMPPAFFRQRLELLKKHNCAVLPLGEAVDRLYAGTLPPRAVSLTFDDGNRDFRINAAPLLEEFGYPGTVYLTTYYSFHRYPVFNVFYDYLLWKSIEAGKDPSADVAAITGGAMPPGSPRADLIGRLRSWLIETQPDHGKRHEAGERLARTASLDYADLAGSGMTQIMSPEEVSDISRRGFRVELHTHRHRTPDDEALFRREIQDNRRSIEQLASHQPSPVHFCYPSGTHFPSLYPWLKAENVRSATTCQFGLAGPETDPLLLPRLIDTCFLSALDFEGWISGVSQMLPRRT